MLGLNSLNIRNNTIKNRIHKMYKNMIIYKETPKSVKNCPIKLFVYNNIVFNSTKHIKLDAKHNSINKQMRESMNKLNSNIEPLNINVITKSKINVRIPCTKLSGKIENYKIIDEILYNYYTDNNMNEICLSDIYGTFHFTNFKIIIDYLIKLRINFDRIGLELHIFNSIDNSKNVKNIILYAKKNGIYKINIYNMSGIIYSNV